MINNEAILDIQAIVDRLESEEYVNSTAINKLKSAIRFLERKESYYKNPDKGVGLV